jgi:hypothetical protein
MRSSSHTHPVRLEHTWHPRDNTAGREGKRTDIVSLNRNGNELRAREVVRAAGR